MARSSQNGKTPRSLPTAGEGLLPTGMKHPYGGEDITDVVALHSAPQRSSYTARLLAVSRELQQLEADLTAEGMIEEAGSVATVIADLAWQCQEIGIAREDG